MKRKLLFLAVTAFLTNSLLNGQTLYVPGANGSTPGIGVSSNGNVGIGATSPQSKLHINSVCQDCIGLTVQGSTINNDGTRHYIGLSLDGDYGNGTGNVSQIRSYSNLYANWGSSLTFHTTAVGSANTLVERMRIDYNGNVGIGTSSPLQKFVVSNASAEGLEVYLGQPTGVVGLQSYNRAISAYSKLQFDASQFAFTKGNVGIGTYSPSTSLEIAGATTINPANPGNNYLLFKNNGTSLGIIGSDASISGTNPNNMGMYVYGNNSLEFWTYSTKRMVISGSGNLGIGVPLPGEKLEINGNLKFINNGSKIFLGTNDYIQFTDGDKDGYKFIYDDAERLRITNYGNVLIGKTSQINTAYKLDVEGSIRANEIIVNTTGADFVFEPAYQLMSLQDLETYLKTNRHLPGIATATEMQENGVSAGEMQTKLLQKVEEATLYIIDLQKQVNALKKENEQLREEKQEQQTEQLKMFTELKKEVELIKHNNQ